jgi:UDP-N-acetyl-D-mannosaminuronate dehydrogenase
VRIHDGHVLPFAGAHVDPLDLAVGADAVVLMVAHNDYRALDLASLKQRMRTPVLVDGRHVVDTAAASEAGLDLISLGVG